MEKRHISILAYMEGMSKCLERRDAYLLATLELLDVANLWVGKAVVDFNPLHGDILRKTNVSGAQGNIGRRRRRMKAYLNTTVVGVDLSIWSNWANPLKSLGRSAGLTGCMLMSNWNKRSIVDWCSSRLSSLWSSEGLWDPMI